MEIRQSVIAMLKPLLPAEWRLIPYSTNLDVLDRTVVMLKLQSIKRTPEAPLSGRTIEFTLTIIEPRIDPEKREDYLDDNLIDLVNAIDQVPFMRWSTAQRVMANESNLAFDITLEVVTSKETETA